MCLWANILHFQITVRFFISFYPAFLTFFNSFILIQLLLQSNLWLIFKISVSLADKYKKQII